MDYMVVVSWTYFKPVFLAAWSHQIHPQQDFQDFPVWSIKINKPSQLQSHQQQPIKEVIKHNHHLMRGLQ